MRSHGMHEETKLNIIVMCHGCTLLIRQHFYIVKGLSTPWKNETSTTWSCINRAGESINEKAQQKHKTRHHQC